MIRFKYFGILFILAMAMSWAANAPAEEQRMRFLHSLQQSSYADLALEYLDMLQAQPDLPPLFRETLDLERCNTYLAWSRIAANEMQAQQFRTQSQAYLNKFLATHPGHPAASMVKSFAGGMSLDRGRALLASAKLTTDPARKTSLQAEGVAVLNEAKKQLDEALDLYRTWLKLLANEAKDASSAFATVNAAEVRAKQAEVTMQVGEALFKSGLVAYYLANQEDEKSYQRHQGLTDAAHYFDAAFQQWRSMGGSASLWALVWQARALDPLGDKETVQDILDEVLANDPEKTAPQAARDSVPQTFAAIYAEARLLQFRQLARQGKLELLLHDASEWLRTHGAWSQTPGYQGIALEAAKAQLAYARRSDKASRQATLKQLAADLANAAQMSGEYKDEALLLHRQVLKELGTDLSVQETLALGDAALGLRDFAQATDYYHRALAAIADKDPQQTASIQERINHVRYAQAAALFAAKKYDAALQAALQLAQENPADPSVGRAALLAISAAISQATAATDKADLAAAQTRLEQTIHFVTQKWANQPEADDALILRGQWRLRQGDGAGAMASFAQIKPTSHRYATVMLIEGQIAWKAYLDERNKEPAARNAAQMQEAREKAQALIAQAVERLKNETSLNNLESALPLIEAQNLAADILIEGKEYNRVVALLEPTLAKIKIFRPLPLNDPLFHTVVVAIQAHLSLGNTAQVSELALLLSELATDRPQDNHMLMQIARILQGELQRAETAITKASSDVTGGYQKAIDHRDAIQKTLVNLLPSLLKREHYAGADMASLGSLCMAMGQTPQAMQLYQHLVQQADADPAFAQEAGQALVVAKAQVVGLLRTQGKYQEAVKQSDDLIAQSPHTIEPRLIRARILEDWAQDDPAKFAPAITQWTEIRTMLGRLPKKLPEYYQALYHTAACLYSQWTITRDATSLNQAEQILQSSLVLDAQSIPADLLPQYQDLLKRIAAARKASPATNRTKSKTR